MTNAISQVIATTAGETYIFSTDGVTRSGDSSGDRISFIADGATLDTVTTTRTWAGYSTAFTAAATTTTIKLQSAGSVSGGNAGPDDGTGGIVDNVQVQELNVTPTGPLSAVEDTQTIFTGFSVASNAAGNLTVTISAANGTLTLNRTTGLTFTVGDGTADQTMTFSGSGSNVSAALGVLRYTGKPNFNGADTITQTVTVGSVTDTETVAVTVSAVDDAPVAVNDAVRLLSGQTATGNVLANDSEVEGAPLTVTQFSWGGTTVAAGQTVTLSGVGTLTIGANGAYTITPVVGFTGAVPAATYTVSEGALTSTATLVFFAEWVNDAPSGSDKTITMLEDGSYSFAAEDFGLTDPLDDPANALKAVVITTLPTKGTMTLAGVAVTAGQTVLAADLGSLVFRPLGDYGSPAHATFTFQVVDDGGTANGGIDKDPTPNTITIDLIAVNDPPHGANKTITTLQNGAYTFAVADFGFSDRVDDNGFKAVVITTLPTQGSLTLAGAAVTAGQTILAADLGSLVWRPTDGGASGYASFTFQVVDDGGTDNAGLDTDPTPNRITWQNFVALNLAVNGDFTLGSTGWSASSLQIDSRYASVYIPASPTGGNYVELEGLAQGVPGSTNAIWQNVSTQAGETYIFSTDAVTRNGSGNIGDKVSFIAGGTTLATVTTGSTWGSYSTAFTGAAGSTQIKLQSAGSVSGPQAGADDQQGGYVDNVQVQELTVTPAGPLTVVKDAETTFKGFSVATNATGDLTVTLSAANGTLTLADRTGLTFTVGDGAGDQTMTFSGSGVAVGAALSGLRYKGNAGFTGSDTITQTVTAGTMSGSVTDTDTVSVNVAAVNGAPTGVNDVAGTAENQAVTGNVLTNDSDIEGSPLSVTQFTWNGVTTAAGGTGSIAGVGTLTIAANGAYVFTPSAGYAGAVPSATYTLSDGSLTATATLSFTLSGVNDPPSGADKTITVLEDGSYGFTAADFGFTDANDSPSNALKSVVIATLPTAGTLTLAGAAVSAGQTVLAANLGSLVFSPAANANGTGYASFTFRVVDDGGTANGGVDTDPTPNTITFDVTPVNDAPAGVNDTAPTAENQVATGNVLTNDGDIDGDPLSVTQFVWGGVTTAAGGTATLAGVGTLSIAANGAYVFTPAPGYAGAVPAATYTLSDGSLTATAVLSFSLDAVNDAPSGADRTITLAEDGSYTLTAADFGFTDPNDSPANGLKAVVITTLPTQGTLTLGGLTVSAGQSVLAGQLGSLVWRPAANANGAGYASFTFQVVDDGGTANGGVDTDPTPNTITFDVTPVNDAPAGVNDTAPTAENQPATGNVLTNDGDIDGDPLSVTQFVWNGVTTTAGQTATLAGVGTLSIAANGAYVFTPAAGYAGAVPAATYTLSDGSLTATAVLSFSLDAVNDAPSGADRTITLPEDGSHAFTAADFGFTDPNDSPANGLKAVVITTLPTQGTLTLSGAAVTAGQSVLAGQLGSLVWRPAANANGAGYASFTFQVVDDGGTANGGVDTDPTPNTITFDVTPVNDAPAGVNDTAPTAENQPATGNVLTNDGDIDGDPLTVTQFVWGGVTTTAGQTATLAGVGTLSIAANGAYVFTPAAGYAGAVPVATYTLSDGSLTSTATLSFTLAAVNDAPSGADGTITVLEDGTHVFTAADFGFTDPNDSPANGLKAVVITTLPTQGTLTLGGVAVTAGQSVLAGQLGSLVWRPAANANGAGYASFTFQVVDDGGTANGGVDTDPTPNTITFDVTPVNDAPAGVNDTAPTAENQPATGNVLTNDGDIDGDPLSVTQFVWNGVTTTAGQTATLAGVGTLSIAANGGFTFTPAAGYAGAVPAATYTLSDGSLTATAVLSFSLDAVNDAPSGADRTITLPEDGSHAFTAADFGFTDPNDSPANGLKAVVITTLPTQGTLTLSGAAVTAGQSVLAGQLGSLVWRPAANANGTGYASFTFQVVDDGGTANGGVDTDPTPNTITFDVTPVNDAPAGVNDTAPTAENQVATGNVLTNDGDIDGDPLSVTQFVWNGVTTTAGQTATLAGVGTLSIAANGAYVFTPAAGYAGAVPAATYTLSDGSLTATAVLSFSLDAVNDAPSGADRTITLPRTAAMPSRRRTSASPIRTTARRTA